MHHHRNFSLTLLISFLSVIFILAAITFIAPLRASAVHLLLSYDSTSSLADAIAANTGTTTPAAATSAPVDNSGSDQSAPTVTLYQYRLLRNVDPCTFNKLGAQGFQSVQYGGNVDTEAGLDENCKSSREVSFMDWVLFQKETQQ